MQVVPVSTRISPWKSSLKRMEPFQLDALYSYYSMLGALRSSLNFTPENITYELKKQAILDHVEKRLNRGEKVLMPEEYARYFDELGYWEQIKEDVVFDDDTNPKKPSGVGGGG